MNPRLKEFIGMLADYGQAVVDTATEIHTNAAREADNLIRRTEEAAVRLAEYFHGGYVDREAIAVAVAPVSPDHTEKAAGQQEG